MFKESSARRRVVALFIVCSFGACSLSNEPGIAQLTAEELNLRIPDEQSQAFDDGSISGDEVEAAFASFEACARDQHADSLSASLSKDFDFQMTFEPEDRERVHECQTTYFEATYRVFVNQSSVAESQQRDR